MTDAEFNTAFAALSGNAPFPWQRALFRRFCDDRPDNIPASCNLPTGLGKTSVIAVWLIALAAGAAVPRRLVYVVNRRTVVDQTTEEVEKYRSLVAHGAPPLLPELIDLADRLRALSSDPTAVPLALSTLRGQFADNREWSADPSRPAVICGTVDMIGSRLLFGGYGCGFRTRPLHAGFLGQDSLVVHDEAHLEPAFQELLLAIEKEQKRCGDLRPLKVMELTATSRAGGEAFGLTAAERNPPENLPDPKEPIHHLWQRLRAKKGLAFHVAKRGEVAREIGHLARARKGSGLAILVFVRTPDDVKTVQDVLTDRKEGVPASQVQTLTGTLRGRERDRLATADPVFARFLPRPHVTPREGTLYLICTSAGEVGVDISADHLVCDLTPLDSMAQRLGRVNRRGTGTAEVDVVYESDPDPKPKSPQLEAARWQTKAVLERLPECSWVPGRREASPLALRELNLSSEDREATFTPQPTILRTSDILFDAWALTTIGGRLPGRPPVEPYLHGLPVAWVPPETHVAWREEVERVTGDLLTEYRPAALLDAFPLKPHEVLRDRSDRVFEGLRKLKAPADTPVWVVSDDAVDPATLGALVAAGREGIERKTVLLPPSAGGLEGGLLSADSSTADDVSDGWVNERGERRRARAWDDDPAPAGMRKVLTVDTRPDADDADDGAGEPPTRRFWHWYELRAGGDGEGSTAGTGPVSWRRHTRDVVGRTGGIVGRLSLGDEVSKALVAAAWCHDLGKLRKAFQAVLGNPGWPAVALAKSGKAGGRVKEYYRHEFGSLVDVDGGPAAEGLPADVRADVRTAVEAFGALPDEMKELVRHVIATHHGRGRPHFGADEAFDPERPDAAAQAVAREVPRRFARLQRRFGRWGLAYLESLLRAADYAASADPGREEGGV